MCKNGVVFKTVNIDESGHPIILREVIECSDEYENTSKAESEYGQRVCNWILNWLGVYGSKHDEYRVRVLIEKQDGSFYGGD